MVNERNYTWKDIAPIIKDCSKTYTTIAGLGSFGSTDVNHDVDLFITKKPGTPIASFYQEVHQLLDKLSKTLEERYQAIAVRFSCASHQEEVLALAGYNIEKDLALHVHTYTSLEAMKKHWHPCLNKGDNVEDIVQNAYNPIIGTPETFFHPNFQKGTAYDAMLLYLNDCDRINSHFAPQLLLSRMNHIYNYICKHIQHNEIIQALSPEEVSSCFYKIAEIIEKKGNEIKE